ncbi:MAG: beta-ketoacyl-[acyl-carrier-protein] synthase family protein [Bdellovibrionales bacterium]
MGQSKLSHRFTGLGVVSAAGWGLEATAARLFAGAAHDAKLIDAAEARFFKLLPQPSIVDFAPNVFALAAAEEALRDAGLTPEKLATLRIGVCVGSTVGCTNLQEEFGHDYYAGKLPDAKPLAEYFVNNTAQFLARHFGARGPVQMLSNACTSGADAIGVAANWLDADLCDLVICGGTETILPRMYFGFRSLMLCSPVLCKPFDRNRQGLTLGEGAGILVLEKNSTVRESRGEFLGYGCGSDAFHPTSPDPETRGLSLAVSHSAKRTGLNLRDVDFVNTHGTGTPHNDLAEGRWISKNTPQTRVVATKAYTGHCLGSAGAIEAVLTLLSLQRQALPPSLGFVELDPAIGITPTLEVESGKFNTALSLSLGFGGINSALCLGRPQ